MSLVPRDASHGETQAQVLLRLLSKGGYVLIVGGEMSNLPERITKHPQILIWEDNQQGMSRKEVPRNTRAIVYNRWVSHATALRLRKSATQLGIPTFPMLRTREVKELMAELAQEEPVTLPPPPSVEQPAPAATEEEVSIPEPPESDNKGFLTNEDLMRPPKRGEMTKVILPKELKADESSTEGAKRLLSVLKADYGIKMTEGALVQAIIKYRHDAGITQGRKAAMTGNKLPRKTTKPTAGSLDDFSEAERLLRDARTALDLMLEFLPKLRTQVDAQRDRQKRLRELLAEELD